MIKEEYVQHDTAKLLKDAGFPQVRKLFDGNIKIQKRMAELMPETAQEDFCTTEYHYRADGTEGVLKSRFDPNTCYAMPSQSLAMRWLREEKSISVEPAVTLDEQWSLNVFDFKAVDVIVNDDASRFPTYEAAVEAGIQAACKYIIKNNQ